MPEDYSFHEKRIKVAMCLCVITVIVCLYLIGVRTLGKVYTTNNILTVTVISAENDRVILRSYSNDVYVCYGVDTYGKCLDKIGQEVQVVISTDYYIDGLKETYVKEVLL